MYNTVKLLCEATFGIFSGNNLYRHAVATVVMLGRYKNDQGHNFLFGTDDIFTNFLL